MFGFEDQLVDVARHHDLGSRMLIIFRPRTVAERKPKIGAQRGSNRALSSRWTLKTRGKRVKCIRLLIKLQV